MQRRFRCNSAEVLSLLSRRAPRSLHESEIVQALGIDRVELRVLLRLLWRTRFISCTGPGVWALAAPIERCAPPASL